MLHVAGDEHEPTPQKSAADARNRARTAAIEHHETVRDAAAKLAVGHPRASAAWSRIIALRRLADIARDELLAFEALVGALVERISRTKWIALLLAFASSTGAEVVLGFPGIKFLVGSTGDLPLLEDWRALIGAVGIAAISVLLATQAARQIVLGQRVLLADPDRSFLTHESRTARPELLTLELDELMPSSPVTAYAIEDDGALPQRSAPAAGHRANGEDADGAHADEGMLARYRHVLMDDRTRTFRLVSATLLVTLGICMWGAIGVFRSHVVSLRSMAAPVTQGFGQQAPSATARSGDGPLETMMAIGPIIFFLAQVAAGAALTSTLGERRRHLAARAKEATRNERHALEGHRPSARRRPTDIIRAYEGLRAKIEFSRRRQRHRIDAIEDEHRGLSHDEKVA